MRRVVEKIKEGEQRTSYRVKIWLEQLVAREGGNMDGSLVLGCGRKKTGDRGGGGIKYFGGRKKVRQRKGDDTSIRKTAFLYRWKKGD